MIQGGELRRPKRKGVLILFPKYLFKVRTRLGLEAVI